MEIFRRPFFPAPGDWAFRQVFYKNDRQIIILHLSANMVYIY